MAKKKNNNRNLWVLIITTLVIVFGFTFYSLSNKNYTTVNQAKSDVSAWKTYTGNGITFQYPSDWELTDSPLDKQGVVISSPESGKNGKYDAIQITSNASFTDKVRGYTENIDINGIKGYRQSLPAVQNPAQEGFTTYRNNVMFQVFLFYDNKNYVDTYNKLLSTFKFTQ